MNHLTTQTVESIEDRRAFVSFPWRVYQDDPHWVPPLFSERMLFIDPEHHPFFEHAEVDFFLAKRGDDVVGTIAAFTNYRHNEFQEENIGFFGFFEVLDDSEAAKFLLETAENWVRERGHDAIRGPAQYSTNEECGLLVDGFDDPPRILMTYNPPRYVDYIEGQGYQKAMDLHAYAQDTDILAGGSKFPQKLVRVVKKIKEKGDIHIRKVDLKNYDLEVERVKKIYNQSWARNWGFVPMTDAEFVELGKELRPILDPDLTLVAEIDGEPIGVSITLPDLNQPLRLAYPSSKTPEWLTMLKLVWNWKITRQVTWARVLILGVLPEHRMRGVDALFYYETAIAALKKGIKHAEMSWILENNDAISRPIRVMGGEIYKTYRFYEKAL
ncbi:MAG: N-acetyltransferase [Anaerolineales bacterium]|nr:N-acetyltransferase [Chloroflexota bacterium]MBL6981489.1 N-acetyltransferase [Anaerolineales bacterium]